MKRVRWSISPPALALLALAYFLDGSGAVSALMPAALAHELGHILALRFCSRRLTGVSLTLGGFALDYAPRLEGAQAALCAFAGPLLGAFYAVCACSLGGSFWRMSGAVGFALSVFNLLPILPLDGGRIAAALLPAALAERLSLYLSAALFLACAVLCLRHRALLPLPPFLWLLTCNLRARFTG